MRPATILAADDVAQEAEVLQDYFCALGYQVEVAHDGMKTLAKARALKPDILLLDVKLPDVDGFEVCRRLKADPATADIPVLMITGLTDIEDRLTGLGLGAEDYVTKPYDLAELAARVATRIRAKQRADALREDRKRILQTLQRYVAPPVVEQLLADPAAPRLGGVRQEVTVLFVDLMGFTRLAERLEPERLIQVLNAHLSVVAEAILAYKGTPDKIMGDAMMALFNAPTPQSDHTERAVGAALVMQTSLAILHQELPSELRLNCRAGIHTGEAIVGNIGTRTLMTYTAVGDAVNLARRLQQHATEGQILISGSTYQRVADVVEAALLGSLTVRGRQTPVATYALLGWKR